MNAPIRRLLKREAEWLGTNFCKHGHTYLSHYACFIKDQEAGKFDGVIEYDARGKIVGPFRERVGFLDIEASNLHADFGYMFSYCIKELDGKILGRALTTSEVQSFVFDKRLVRELIVDIKKFHRLIVHWGKDRRYDMPFIRTRALRYNLDFPQYKDLYIQDTWDMAKQKLCLSRNRLESICNFFEIPSKGHKLNPNVWQKALAGDKKSLRYILLHNQEDVVSLEAVWKKLHNFVPTSKTSI